MAPKEKDKAARTVCSSDDYYIFLEYLEDRSNYEKLFGTGKRTTVGGKNLSRAAVWDIAASEVRAMGFQNTTGQNLYKKWNRYYTKYREAKQVETQSGGGLNEEDVENGITIAEKLNAICNHYFKVDALMGKRLNVKPPAKTGPMGFQATSFQADFSQTEQHMVDISAPTQPEDGTATKEAAIPEPTPATADWAQDISEELLEDADVEVLPATLDIAGTTVSPAKETAIAGAIAGASAGATGPKKTSTKSAADQGKQRHQKGPIAAGKSPTGPLPLPKPSLATVFMESKLKEAELRMQFMEKKVHWKMAEVRDKQEARCDELKKRQLEIDFEVTQRQLERDEKREESMKAQKHAMMEGRRQRFHAGQMGKQNNKLQVILAGWAQQKSPEEIEAMCRLLDP